MSILKSNLCPKCGGLLDIDLDKQIYVCPYCGVSFDYEYFREDNVKDVAAKSIARSEYGAARDAYEFMLSKDPHDFEALRGLFICANKWKSLHPMLRESDVYVTSDEPSLTYAIENCRPEHKGYFEKIREALIELSHFRDLRKQAHTLDVERVSAQKELDSIRVEYEINKREFTNSLEQLSDLDPKTREAILSVSIMFPLLMIGLAIWQKAWWFLIMIAAIIIVIVVSYNVVKAINSKRILARMVPAENKVKELSDQHKAKSAEAEQSHWKYKTLVEEFLEMDPMPQKSPEKYSVLRRPK